MRLMFVPLIAFGSHVIVNVQLWEEGREGSNDT